MRTDSLRPQIGDPAPDLTLPTETGNLFSLAKVGGRATLVSFLSHAA